MSTCPVSVIIPAFNCRTWVRQAVDSALHQTVSPFEVIVIDDGSTDGTAEVLASYGPRIRLIVRPNGGVATARNAGLRAARGEMIAFLDADDLWHPRKLEYQLGVMARHPRLGLLGTRTFDAAGPAPLEIGPEGDARVAGIEREDLAVRNYLTTSSILVRRELVGRVGEFDADLCGPEDHDYWLRVADIAPIGVLAMPLTGYRSVPGSLSTRAAAMEAGMRRILHKLDRRDFWRGDRLLRRRAYSYVSYSCAYLHGAAGDQVAGVRKLLESLAWYPLPYRREEAGVACGRARRLAVLLLRLLGVMSPDPGCCKLGSDHSIARIPGSI